MEDCNDNPAAGGANQNPGLPEICDDTGLIDENCDGKRNCESASCRATPGIQCDAQCDKDQDGHYSIACDGDDCVDDPAVFTLAFGIHGGLDVNGEPMTETQSLSSCTDQWDWDCDGLNNCADPDCSEHPTCAPPPTPEDCNSCDYENPELCSAFVDSPDPDCCNNLEAVECIFNGGMWVTNGCYCVSPIVIDVLGNGFNLTSAQNGVFFDIINNGSPLKIAWTSGGSDDAWLALDRNGNGFIDRGRELFGSSSPQPRLGPGEVKNGFRALAVYDRLNRGGNHDGKISDEDEVFTELRLWRDVNHNGISEPNEPRSISDAGLRIIDLDYKEKHRFDEHGNWFRFRSKVKDTHGAQLGRWGWDVFLKVQQ